MYFSLSRLGALPYYSTIFYFQVWVNIIIAYDFEEIQSEHLLIFQKN